MEASTTQPTGAPVNGTYWFDPDLNELDIYEVALDSGVQKWMKVSDVQYTSSAPTTDSGGNALADGDYWVDTDEAGYPQSIDTTVFPGSRKITQTKQQVQA